MIRPARTFFDTMTVNKYLIFPLILFCLFWIEVKDVFGQGQLAGEGATNHVIVKRGEDNQLPKEMKDTGIVEKLNTEIPLHLAFTNHEGRQVVLADYFKDKIVVLSMYYYNCPMLCNLVLSAKATVYNEVPLQLGEDFISVSVSFEPKDTHVLSAKAHKMYWEQLSDKVKAGNPNDSKNAWNFLTGSEANIKALAQAIGFKYKYIDTTKEYAHAAAIFILTPKGKIMRYLYGIEYNPRDLQLAIAEAKQSKSRSTVEKLLLYCYNYDPNANGYVVQAINIMKIGGGFTILLLGLTLGTLFRLEAKAKAKARKNTL